MSSISCDIAILPSDNLAKRAIAMSVKLQQHTALFQLSPTGPFPHASLYMTQLKIDDLEKVKEILAAITAKTVPLNLTADSYYQSEGYIDANYARTEVLDRLQMAVVNAINPIRDGLRENDKVRMLEATGKIRENLEKYGYRGVGELFRPHMTLTRFTDRQSIVTSELPNPNEFSGQFLKLGLFEMGDNGTCIRKIAEFGL